MNRIFDKHFRETDLSCNAIDPAHRQQFNLRLPSLCVNTAEQLNVRT